MKRFKLLIFFIAISLCFSTMFFAPMKTDYSQAATLQTVSQDVAELHTEKLITDSTKQYVFYGGNSGDLTIRIRNESNVEQTFYITLRYLYIINGLYAPPIQIEDNGHKTTVNLTIEGSNSLTGSLYGAIALAATSPTINANIVVNFATKQFGSLDLIAERGTVSSPAIYVQNNVNAEFNLNTHNTKSTGITVMGHTYQDFETSITEATKNGRSKCVINLERADSVSNKISFNMMGHGTQIDSVLLPATQTNFTPENVPDVDGLIFYGWYKDITLNHKWDPNTDTVTGDMTLYAGWFIQPPNQNTTSNQMPVWAIVLISVSAGLILLANIYVLIYFSAYKSGKLNNKFFNTIFKPLTKLNNKQENKELPAEAAENEEIKKESKTETAKIQPKEETSKKPEKTEKPKQAANKESKTATEKKTAKKDSLNKNTKNNSSNTKKSNTKQIDNKKQIVKKSK